MKVILKIDGREEIFSNVESISVLEEKDATTSEAKQKEAVEEVTEKQKEKISYEAARTASLPTEGQWFLVNPEKIKWERFKEMRKVPVQESTRKIILEAFEEAKENPKKYTKPFKTFFPVKTWESKTVDELKDMANELGDGMANWVEQALEWAQRISNGEGWEFVCQGSDAANWYRLVVWKNGYVRLVGGSRQKGSYIPAVEFSSDDRRSYEELDYVVPLVVLYK